MSEERRRNLRQDERLAAHEAILEVLLQIGFKSHPQDIRALRDKLERDQRSKFAEESRAAAIGDALEIIHRALPSL